MSSNESQQLEVIAQVLRKPTQSQRIIEQRLRSFDQLPFVTPGLRRSHIQLLSDDPPPGRINPALIRKAKPGNCMLSEPYVDGHVVYFNILKETEEINEDHRSDHFVGLPILEGVRQIGMAISHIVDDIPLDTRMALQDFSLYFLNYIEFEYPIVARAVANQSLGKDLSRDVTAFIDIRQNGVTCLAGTSSGRLFNEEKRYKRTRGKTRNLNTRYAEEFEAVVRADDERAGAGAG